MNKSRKKLISILGVSAHKIGPSGRIALPSDFRQALVNRGVNRLAVISYQDCLQAWPIDEWEKQAERYKKLSLDDIRVREYLRWLYSNLEPIDVDPQGRMMLLDKWQERFELKERVILVGMDNFFEMWNPEQYSWKTQELEREFSANRDYVARLIESREKE